MTARARARFRLGLAALALAIALHALWLPAKAALAQQLLQRAWAAHLADGGQHRPWPWADSHPVARIRQSRLGIDQIVLAGDSGRVLAFGPGWTEASAAPERGVGNIVISGHRDTHFRWLRDLRPGDFLELQTARGWRGYRVNAQAVVDARHQRLSPTSPEDHLQLVTCWPFDALAAGGPMRWVVSLQSLQPPLPLASAQSPRHSRAR